MKQVLCENYPKCGDTAATYMVIDAAGETHYVGSECFDKMLEDSTVSVAVDWRYL